MDDALITQHLLSLLAKRDPQSSSCPSEVARSLAPDDEATWRSLMPQIREVLRGLMRTQRVRVTRGRQALSEDQLSNGPIRIRRGLKF